MRLALVLLIAGTLIAAAVTSLGPSPGANRFRILMELLVGLGAVGIVVATRPGRLRPVAVVIGGMAVIGIVLLTAPPLRDTRARILAPVLIERERGFILAALGRPDLVTDGGIGLALDYAYMMPSARGNDALLVHFAGPAHFEDLIRAVEWTTEPEARARLPLSSPGQPGSGPP